jgi:hypothetical protein
MSSLIVVRIVPLEPLSPGDFAGYLDPAGLGPLQVTAFELSFADPDVGRNLGTAIFVPVTNAPSPMAPQLTPPAVVLTVPEYKPAAPTHGIVQHFDALPPTPPFSAYF